MSDEIRVQAEQELISLKQINLNLKIQFEQQFSEYESRSRNEMNSKLEKEIHRFEENIVSIQSVRDEIKQRADRLEAEYASLAQKSKDEKTELAEWLQQEKISRINSEEEKRALESKILELEGQYRSMAHTVDVRSVEISHLESMVETLRITHAREQNDLLNARTTELCHFDEKLRSRDDDINKMHAKLREANVRVAQLKEELIRREESYRASVKDIRLAVSQSLSDDLYSNNLEDYSQSQRNSFANKSSGSKISTNRHLNENNSFSNSALFNSTGMFFWLNSQ